MKWRERDSWLTSVVQKFVGGGLAATAGDSVGWQEAVALALVADAADDRNCDGLLRCLASPEAASSSEFLRQETGILFAVIDGMELAKKGTLEVAFQEAQDQPISAFLEAALMALAAGACAADTGGWRAAANVCSAMSELCEPGVDGSILRRAASLNQNQCGSQRVNLAGRLALEASGSAEVFEALTRSDATGTTVTAWLVQDALRRLAELQIEAEVELDVADADSALATSAALPEDGPIANWEVMAARDLGAARRQVGVAQVRRNAAYMFEESTELRKFVKVVAAARAAYWGRSVNDELAANALAIDLCRALAAFPSGRSEGSLLGLVAAATLKEGFRSSAFERLGVLRG